MKKETIQILIDITKKAREEFIAKNVELSKNSIIEMIKVMEDNGWDMDKVAPFPNSLKDNKTTYRTKKAKRQHFSQYFKSVKGATKVNEPNIVVVRDDVFIVAAELATEAANDSFDKYIYKLSEKIGTSVMKADIVGNLWQHSYLTITLNDGTIQKWKTQMIINRSVYGKLFNQFPTRKMKVS